jgi:methyl-accepting chemotaxis protein
MTLFRNLSISRKFICAFGAVCLLCGLLGAVAAIGILKVNSSVGVILTNSIPAMKALGNVRYSIATIRRTDSLLLLCDTDACTTRLATKRKKYLALYEKAIAEYALLVSDSAERELYKTIVLNAKAYIAFSDQSRQLADGGKPDEASRLLLYGDAVKVYNAVADAVEDDVTIIDKRSSETAAQATHMERTLLLFICIFMTITVLLCAGIGNILTRLIVPPLRAVTHALEQLADKDLTAYVECRNQDEIGRLSAALNTSVDSTRNVLRSVMQSAETLSTAAENLHNQATQSSGNANAQSDKSNQIATASQEMTATIGEISRNAETAALASRGSAEAAKQGGAVMQSAAATMEKISSSTNAVAEKMASLSQRSTEIGQVIHVIQEISEQTNLLALNAAIEAARAGEHGRGFAVVAAEVRRLAERTKGATGEISGTIRSIQEETQQTLEEMTINRSTVETGLSETSKAHLCLDSIIDSSKLVENQIDMIATAATEQAVAASEISESVSQIALLSANHSHVAGKAAEGCKNLATLANDLDGIIRLFRFDDDTGPQSATASHQRFAPNNRPAAPVARLQGI